MDWLIQNTADSTRDTESRSNLPRVLPDRSPAEIGDAITIAVSGDRIKVTLLEVIDPAVVTDRGIKGIFARMTGEKDAYAGDVRCVAVKLRMRNLEEEKELGVVHVASGGVLIDSEGGEYSSTGDSVEDGPAISIPDRGAQPKVMCDVFAVPRAATIARYAVALSSSPRARAGEWRLVRSRPAVVDTMPALGLKQQLELLGQGVAAWNTWRATHPRVEIQLPGADLQKRELEGINLSEANLEGARFAGSDLTRANLSGAHARSALFPKATLAYADLSGSDLRHASFFEADLEYTNFERAVLSGARLEKARAHRATLRRADLSAVHGIEAVLSDADLQGAELEGADFTGAFLGGALLTSATLRRTKLTGAYLNGASLRLATLDLVDGRAANFQGADFTGATVTGSDLSLVSLVNANLADATITDTRVFGISAWDLKGVIKHQEEIIITPPDRPRVTVTDLEVANFVYLLLNNEKVRNAIETIGRKGVLILGRFTERKHVLEAIRSEVARNGLLPIVFDFDRPTDRDFTETVMTLAGMSRFIVADITAPRSVPLELQVAVPNYMVPFVPLLAEGERPFSMFEDLWKKYRDWVLEPLMYDSVEQLVRVFKRAVVDPANATLERLRVRKAEQLVTRRASDFDHSADAAG